MPSVNDLVEAMTAVRTRLLVGALLLFAAVLTAFIGLTLNVHSKGMIVGTEHVRDTVVTFKRNGAIGTLILCVISVLLLFPILRRGRPILNRALIVLFALLAGSSVYTLLSLAPTTTASAKFDENLATEYVSTSNASGAAADLQARGMGATPGPQVMQLPTDGATGDSMGRSSEEVTSGKGTESVDSDGSVREPSNTDEGTSPIENQPENRDADENQEPHAL